MFLLIKLIFDESVTTVIICSLKTLVISLSGGHSNFAAYIKMSFKAYCLSRMKISHIFYDGITQYKVYPMLYRFGRLLTKRDVLPHNAMVKYYSSRILGNKQTIIPLDLKYYYRITSETSLRFHFGFVKESSYLRLFVSVFFRKNDSVLIFCVYTIDFLNEISTSKTSLLTLVLNEAIQIT